jgi:uncharacterized protein YciI
MDESCFLYVLKATRVEMLTSGPTDREAVVLGEHVDYLSRLADEDRVLLAGRTQTHDVTTFGIVIFVAATEEKARSVVEGDPAVRAGVMTASLYPYKVAVLGSRMRRGSAPPSEKQAHTGSTGPPFG